MERYAIVAFSSRTQVFQFEELFKRERIPAEVVHTPQRLRLGCGLSLKIPVDYLPKAREACSRQRAQSLAGFYILEERNGRVYVMGDR